VHAEPFTDALRPHYDDALRYCRALCARWAPEEAEDVLQQSLLQAMEGFGSLRDGASFRPWLFRIITRVYAMAARRHFWRRFVPLPERDDGGERMPHVYTRADHSPGARRLRAALARLPDRDRAALLLFEVAGLSLDEVAAAQGDRSLSAVKSRLARAREKLRRLMDEPLLPAVDGALDVERATAAELDRIEGGRR
jgi:RNA polymerase sigma-70 factor (ECF subfamily)